jgi:hypothetical protein
MRPAALALAGVLAIGAVAAPAAASGKRAKRATDRCAKRTLCAKVRRPVTRSVLSERLLDLTPPAAPAPPQPEDPAPTLPSFVSVAAREFSLTLSRPLVAAGNIRIELRNVGEDPHNLVVSPEGSHSTLDAFSTLDPGLYERRTVALAPGRYQLWCSLEGHEALGMSVTLRVQ